MWAAYNQCRAEGRGNANVQLLKVDPDGRAYYRTYTSSYGGAEFERCIDPKIRARANSLTVPPAPPPPSSPLACLVG
jgi:hypothetical protein